MLVCLFVAAGSLSLCCLPLCTGRNANQVLFVLLLMPSSYVIMI